MVMLCLALAAAIVSASCQRDSGRSAVSAPAEGLTCLDAAALKDIRSSRDAVTLRARTESLYARCESELFGTRIPAGVSGTFTPEQRFFIFSSILAHTVAPYGPSKASSLADLIRSETLHCGSYALLTANLFLNSNRDHTGKLVILGFDGGAVEAHAQVLYEPSKHLRPSGGAGTPHVLVDPTVGIVAVTTFNDLLQGKPVPEGRIFSFYSHGSELAAYRQQVKDALRDGLYKPYDLLYFYTSLDRFRNFVERSGDQDAWRYAGTLPTPASQFNSEELKLAMHDFHRAEFRDDRQIMDLCRAINRSNYSGISCTATDPDKVIAFLNELLRVTNFYDLWEPRQGRLALSGEAQNIIRYSSGNYVRRIIYYRLPNRRDRKAITELNRTLLETTYPEQCPKRVRDRAAWSEMP